MADATLQAVGLSIGATYVAAVTSDTAVRRTPVLTFFGQRPPVVGLPGENPQATTSGERGQVLTDFVDRVGDPVGILASDGSSHRGESLLAESLRALTHLAGRGRPWPDVAAVTYPAHWRPRSVDALRRAMGRVPEWSQAPIHVLSDVEAAVTALQQDPGLPARGVIAVCDFGGSGTSITLVDAANGYRPIGATVRHLDFSGDLIDQAVLTHVIGDLAGAGSVDLASTSAIGSLSKLRASCRGAKERLSASTVTALPVELPGYRGDVRLTRVELDETLRAPISGVLDVLEDLLRRNGIRPTDLAAIATVGGGAAIVAVTTTLSEGVRVPVITSPRPGLSAATGAALRALRGPADDNATALAPAPAMVDLVPTPSPDPDPAAPSLAWSQADDIPELMPETEYGTGLTGARPQVEFLEDPEAAAAENDRLPWYRRPTLVMAAAAVGLLAAVGGIGVALTDSSATPIPPIASTPEPAAPSAPALAPAPEPLVAQPPAPAPQVQNPRPAPVRTVTAMPPPVTRTQVVQAPVSEPPPPPPTTTTTPPPPPTTTTPPPTPTPTTTTPPPPATETVTETVPPPSTEAPPPAAEPEPPATEAPQWIPTIPPIPTIPGLPPVVPEPASP